MRFKELSYSCATNQTKCAEIWGQYDIGQGVGVCVTVNMAPKPVFARFRDVNVMTENENEIEHAANNMIERYGDNALKEVDLRILELESRNQQDAVQLWLEIRKRLESLLASSSGRAKH